MNIRIHTKNFSNIHIVQSTYTKYLGYFTVDALVSSNCCISYQWKKKNAKKCVDSRGFFQASADSSLVEVCYLGVILQASNQ